MHMHRLDIALPLQHLTSNIVGLDHSDARVVLDPHL